MKRDFNLALAGNDTVSGLGAADFPFGQKGADTLDCGEHEDDRDRAVIRPGDTAVNCERVRTLA